MGPGHPAIPLDRATGQPKARRVDDARLLPRAEAGPREQAPYADRRPKPGCRQGRQGEAAAGARLPSPGCSLFEPGNLWRMNLQPTRRCALPVNKKEPKVV